VATEAAGPYAKNAGMPSNNAERVVARANAERGARFGRTPRGGLPGTLPAVRLGKVSG
jgi:hypothetical protein